MLGLTVIDYALSVFRSDYYKLNFFLQPHKKYWDMGGGDAKPDQNQGMFQNSPWNRPRDDGGWSGGGSSQGGMVTQSSG